MPVCGACHHRGMADDRFQPDDDAGHRPSFEETLRAIAQEVSRAVERVSEIDLESIARSTGADPDSVRHWIEGAGQWLRDQVEHVDITPFFPGEPGDAGDRDAGGAAATDPLHGAGPHPLDVPTADQGLALAALESGRWTLEPGTSALAARGDGPAPSDALGLVRELRVRDWIGADGRLTVVGRHALGRWLSATDRS
ncbi:MAG: hypothetical protein QOD44_1579 [Solirubrobacteraceae bacterium]|nr:hypothetical protein [Solirubrobacteraceae bacterium]